MILDMVDQLLAETDSRLSELDALAFGRGPGAFTGVRIATGVIQGLAFGARLPVIPVSTLAALAQSAAGQDNSILAAIDARMGEIYWGLFNTETENSVVAINEEKVSKPDEITISFDNTWHGVGSGWDTYGDILQSKLGGKLSTIDSDCFPRARHVLELAIKEFNRGNTVTAEQALPVYLRNKVTF